MSRQSTRNLLMIEPAGFAFNAETAVTNDFQMDARAGADTVQAEALAEFRAFRDALVEAGATVTTLKGPKGCPDALFPNWFSTHEDGTAWFYPMLSPSRKRERGEHLIAFLQKFYMQKSDFLVHEIDGRALEGTGSMVLDRVNRVAYIGISNRTDEKLALEWCARTRYEPVVFETVSHSGKPVFHTNMILWIGTEICAIGKNCITEQDRKRVLESLSRTREVIELDNAQIRGFCGNAMEVLGHDDQPMLVMSDTAEGLLSSDQQSRLNHYMTKIISGPLGTIETYGGASAGSMIQGLF